MDEPIKRPTKRAKTTKSVGNEMKPAYKETNSRVESRMKGIGRPISMTVAIKIKPNKASRLP